MAKSPKNTAMMAMQPARMPYIFLVPHLCLFAKHVPTHNGLRQLRFSPKGALTFTGTNTNTQGSGCIQRRVFISLWPWNFRALWNVSGWNSEQARYGKDAVRREK